MPFTIPNTADAAFSPQAQVDNRDFQDILALADSLTGVLSGCAVTAQTTPDMTLAVAAGTACVAGIGVTVASGNVTITTANATNPRFDLVCVDNTGTKSVVAGTAAAAPVFPDPAGKLVIAAVYVPANDTAIQQNQVVDKRVAISPFATAGNIAQPTNFTDSVLDAPLSGIGANLSGTLNNSDYLSFIPLLSPVAINALRVYVGTVGVAGSIARLGLYRANSAWYPTSLVVDAGTVAIDTTGEKTASIATTRLAPGRYVPVLNHTDNTAAVVFRGNRLALPAGMNRLDVSALQLCSEPIVSRTNAAFPSTFSGTIISNAAASSFPICPIYFGIAEAY